MEHKFTAEKYVTERKKLLGEMYTLLMKRSETSRKIRKVSAEMKNLDKALLICEMEM